MRKILEIGCVVLLGALFLITVRAVYGPHPLPVRIPTHFDIVGNPDAWSSRSTLEILPFVALLLYLFLTMVARSNSLIRFPDQVTPEKQELLEAMVDGLISWIKTEVVGILLCVAWTMIHVARQQDQSSLLGLWMLIAAVFLTIAFYAIAMTLVWRSSPEPTDSDEVAAPPPD
ncbi:MAG: DUF1648 domain-containing protein [Terracidiphilus sp.]